MSIGGNSRIIFVCVGFHFFMTANNDARAWIDPLKQLAGVLKDHERRRFG